MTIKTKADIDAQPWWSTQRGDVEELLARAEKAELELKTAYGSGFKYAMKLLDKGGHVEAADYLNETVAVVGMGAP